MAQVIVRLGAPALLRRLLLVVVCAGVAFFSLFDPLSRTPPVVAQSAPPIDVGNLTAELRSREARLVALVNEERRDAGLLPLRWNRDLSEAAGWFARDTTERAIPICGHEDTLKRGIGERIRSFGYTNPRLFGELLMCGFTEPAAAVAAWAYGGLDREIMMHPEAREAGAGYYYSVEKRRGFVVLLVSLDESFAPAIINDEAIATTAPQVRLTLHPARATLPAVTHMKIANEPTFEGVPWEPFVAEKDWVLAGGSGWRTVYVLMRDETDHTTLLTDTIYLGEAAPKEQISLDQATNIGSAFSITTLPGIESGAVRLSLGWKLDDPAFPVYRGPSLRVDDADAVGGTALLLIGDEGEGLARAESYELPLNRLLTAYVRLKVADTNGDAEVARVIIKADGQSFGPLRLKASDFTEADVYQEFSLNFAFPRTPGSALAEVEVYRSSEVDLTLDTVRFFGQPLPATTPVIWSAGAGTVRNQGVWARADGAVGDPVDVTFTPVDSVMALPGLKPRLEPSLDKVVFKSNSSSEVWPPNAAVALCGLWCDTLSWQATSNAPWLTLLPSSEGLILTADATGLEKGVHYAVVTVAPGSQAAEGAAISPVTTAVEFWVDGARPLEETEILARIYLPMTVR